MAITALKDITSTAVIGTVSYNGFTFPSIRSIKLQVAPHYDQADRARSYVIYTFVIECLLWSVDGTEPTHSTTMDAMHAALTTPGGELRVSGIGIGTFNVGGVNSDVIWGPKPRPYTVDPVGGFIAHQMVYTIDVALPSCPTSADYGVPLEFNYAITYGINQQGFCTRTVAGYLRIPQSYTSAGATTVTRTADSFWETVLLAFPVPPEFRRSHTHTESADRCQIDFSINDQQIGQTEAYPPGIVDADIDESIRSADLAQATWGVTVSGSIEHAVGYPADWGWQMFYLIAASKLQSMIAAGKTVLIKEITFRRKLFTRKCSFSITFWTPRRLTQILEASGIWKPVPGTNFQSWAASLAGVWGPRGAAGLNNPMPQGDAIVTMCNTATILAGGTVGASLPGGGTGQTSFLTAVDRDSSYLHYQNDIIGHRSNSLSVQKSVQSYTPQTSPGTSTSDVNMGAPFFTATPDTIEFSSVPTDRFVMSGRAVRVGYDPEIPSHAIGTGTNLVEVDRQVLTRVVGLIGDVPVYGAQWQITYQVGGNGSQEPVVVPPGNKIVNTALN